VLSARDLVCCFVPLMNPKEGAHASLAQCLAALHGGCSPPDVSPDQCLYRCKRRPGAQGVLTEYYTADPEACGGQGAAAERRGAPAVLLVRAHGRAGAACCCLCARAGACAHAPALAPSMGRRRVRAAHRRAASAPAQNRLPALAEWQR
jgi:hypothetical protein